MRETIISRNAINCNAQCWHMNKNLVAKECSWNDAAEAAQGSTGGYSIMALADILFVKTIVNIEDDMATLP